MKKSMWVIIACIVLVAIIVCVIIFAKPGNVEVVPESTSATEAAGYPSDVMYNGRYIPYPFTLEAIVRDGWYFYGNNPEGYIVLTNDKYPDVTVVIEDPRYLNKNLEGIGSSVNCLKFDFNPGCSKYPNVVIKEKVGYKSSKEDVELYLGSITSSDGYFMNDCSYDFLTIQDSANPDVTYDVVLVDNLLKSICIKINGVEE